MGVQPHSKGFPGRWRTVRDGPGGSTSPQLPPVARWSDGPRPRPADPRTLPERVADALLRAQAASVDVSLHRAAIERRLEAMTRKIAARDAGEA
jgi:hypothetical protein